MIFLQITDFKAVCDDATLQVISQQDDENLSRAENYAIEEISSYIRNRYNVSRTFSASEEERNQQIVMITADVTLYHLVAWLPKRIGFEIRELRYKRAIEWLVSVQSGKATPDIPLLTDDDGNDIGNPVKFGSLQQNSYEW